MKTYYRHKVYGSTIFSFRDTRESRFFSNGGTDLHLYGSVINIRKLV